MSLFQISWYKDYCLIVTLMFASGYLVIVIKCGMRKELTVFSEPRDCCILVNSSDGACQVV
jgi:hypothetical protein